MGVLPRHVRAHSRRHSHHPHSSDTLRLFRCCRWNLFDFFILIITFAPFGGDAFSGLRVLRLIKLLRSASADLMPQTIVVLHAFLAGIDAFKYIGALWILQIYIFAVAGCILFGKNDPVRVYSA
jgi:hypothetical protein